MNLHFSFKSAKSVEVEREIQQQVEKLQKRLHAFRPDLVHLHGTLDTAPKEGFGVTLNLRLPSGQLTAQDNGGSAAAAVKIAFSDLLSQLSRHKELLRSEHRWRRDKRTMRGTLESIENTVEGVVEGVEEEAVPTMEAGYTAERNSEVRTYINASLVRLERFIARELQLRESNGDLQPGSLSREEVLDEVVVQALSTDDRPEGLSVERWLYRFAIQAIRELSRSDFEDGSALPLEAPAGQQNVTGNDEDFLQFHQPEEKLNRADTMADTGHRDPEQAAASDEQMAQLTDALRGARSEERQAFMLFALEGFTLEEIVQVTDRPAEQVRDSINSVRQQVMTKLPPSNSLKQRLLQHSRVA